MLSYTETISKPVNPAPRPQDITSVAGLTTRTSAEGSRCWVKIDPRTFIRPLQHVRSSFSYKHAKVCAIIPTYAPGEMTLQLVKDLLKWNPNIFVYVVDDCTPREHEENSKFFRKIISIPRRVTLLRTPVNKLKAGALNYALNYIYDGQSGYVPDVILTVDDDVVIARATVKNLVTELMSHDVLGAVCSQCRVFNKNKNLLTRLQGLEYVGFNAIRLADEGFLRGPLVMHGMLTAFRASALKAANGFTEGHLIEDYEVTTRLKGKGWAVKSATNAPAWTIVPEHLSKFWRQRTRWSYGGITVVGGVTHPSAIFQDLIGHTLFLATLVMVFVLLFSDSAGYVPSHVAQWIIALSFLQLAIWYAFQLWLMRLYKERDMFDWILRASLFPEFIYGSVMTVALLGSYTFLIFNVLRRYILDASGAAPKWLGMIGGRLFRMFGYTETHWGTRVQ